MKPHPINCPNCNSVQRFPLKDKVEDNFIVKFITCNMCHEEIVVDRYPFNEKKNRDRSNILKMRTRRRDLRIKNG